MQPEFLDINPFEEKYRSKSTAWLLLLLDAESEYEPEAVLAARHEIESRNLSAEEFAAARAEADALNAERQQDARYGHAAVRLAGKLGLKQFSPFQKQDVFGQWLLGLAAAITFAQCLFEAWMMSVYFVWGFPEPGILLTHGLPILTGMIGSILLAVRVTNGWHLIMMHSGMKLTWFVGTLFSGYMWHLDSTVYFTDVMMTFLLILALALPPAMLVLPKVRRQLEITPKVFLWVGAAVVVWGIVSLILSTIR